MNSNVSLASVMDARDEAEGYIQVIQTALDSGMELEEWFPAYVEPLLVNIIPTLEREIVRREAISRREEAISRRNRGNTNFAVSNINAVIPNANVVEWKPMFERLKVCSQYIDSLGSPDDFFDRDHFLEEVRNGNYYMVEFMLHEPRVETSHRDFEFDETAIGIAIMNNDGPMANLLMTDERSQSDLEHWSDNALDIVIGTNNPDKLRLLLSFPQIRVINPEILGEHYGLYIRNPELVRILLVDERLDPITDDDDNYINLGLLTYTRKNNSEIVRVLLADPRSDPAEIEDQLFSIVLHSRNVEMLRIFLAERRLNPAYSVLHITVRNLLLIGSVERANVQFVEVLLNDRRVIAAGLKDALAAAIKMKKQHPENILCTRILALIKGHCPSSSCSLMGGRRHPATRLRRRKIARKTRRR